MRNKTFLAVMTAAILAYGMNALAWQTDRDNVDHTGDHIFSEAGSVDLRGTVKVGGTEVTATASELNLLDGVTATMAEINAAADLSSRVVSVTTTNGQAITLSASTPVVILTGTGGAASSTNTVTLALPYPLYQTFVFTVASGSTNKVALADSTTVLSLGANWVGDATDSLTIFTTATNKAVEVASADN